MSQVKKISLQKSISKELEDITQARKILRELIHNKDILSFERYLGTNKKALEYRIFYYKERFFYLRFFLASYHPIKGAEYKNEGWQLSIFIDKDCKVNTLKSIVKKNIYDRKVGLQREEKIKVETRKLIAQDKEIQKVLSGIIDRPTFYEETIQKIDMFLTLVNGLNIPIQIKSSNTGIKAHINTDSGIPELKFTDTLFKENGLKNFILKLCKPYLLKGMVKI